MSEKTEMNLFMGPQHPSMHGLWSLRLTIDGETIVGGTSNVQAEVKSFDSANRQLQVYNRTGIFTIPETLTGQTSGAAWTTSSYNTLNNTNSEYDQNQLFETEADSIIDFTQSNPFGEIGGAN